MIAQRLILLALFTALAGCAGRSNGPRYDEHVSAADHRAAERLEQLIDVEYDETPMIDALNDFHDKAAVNVVANWPALKNANAPRDLPVTLKLQRVPARIVLDVLIEQYIGDAVEPIEYMIHEGVVHVSTRRDLSRKTVTRMYDIEPFLTITNEDLSRVALPFDFNPALSSSSQAGDTSSTYLIPDDLSREERIAMAREERIEQLATLIQDTVGQQEDWAAYGGEVSSLRELNFQFIVKTTPANHVEIARLLNALRAAQGKRTTTVDRSVSE